MILGGVMGGMTRRALPLLHGLMDRDISHGRGHLPMAAEAESGCFLPQKDTADNAMGQMAGPAGIICHRLMHLTLLQSSCHLNMTILTSFARRLLGLPCNTGSQTANQKEQNNKLTCFP